MLRLRGVIGSVLATGALVAAAAAPAEAAAATRYDATAAARYEAATTTRYVALGDSYSSGVGTGGYDLAGAPCLRSSQAYAPLWAGRHRVGSFAFLACSGARTADVGLDQVPLVPRDATLITLTVGGNDTGFSAVLSACSAPQASRDSLCTAAVRFGEAAAVTTVPAGLAADLDVVKRRAPRARIVVLGYPRLFERGRCAVAGAPSDRRRAQINEGADILNGALAKVAKTSGARFVDVRARFAGHGVCAPPARAWINGPDKGRDSYHPTAAGYRHGYLPALTAATG